jgi:CubicO group peptidase (beta-lactamase class C family)
MEDINETSNLIKSPSPTRLPVNLTYQLPIDFSSNGKTIDVQDFIDHSMTTGLMIIHKDTIILENYTRGLTPETTHISWSMAKSFISGMIGIAIEEGKIKSIQDQITDYLPQFKGTGYEGVTIKNALEMSSGVGFNEDYSDFNSDINRFGRYFALGQSFEKFALSLKNTRKPGTFNHYVSIDTQVLGMVLKKATGKSITQFMQNKIWNPIGMEDDAQWIIDEDGMELALGGLNATLRDYGKYGLLYLREGNWFGNQIISQNWVKQSITMDGPHLQPGINQFSSNDLGYGLQWWIPQEADGAFLASGIYNQHIYIQPNRDLVIVKLSGNYHFKTNKDLEKSQHIDFFKSIVEQFPKNIIANKTVE